MDEEEDVISVVVEPPLPDIVVIVEPDIDPDISVNVEPPPISVEVISTTPDEPEIETIVVDRKDKPSKSIGEPVTVTVSAAIANAIYDATGARLRELPFMPERVKAALAER